MIRLALVLALWLGLMAPAGAQQAVTVPATMASAPIAIASATTQQIVPLVAGLRTYITQVNFWASAADNVTIVYGTGSNCATGQVTLAGPYTFAAAAGLSAGTGYGAVLVTPPGQAVCITTSTTGPLDGSMAYAQY